jgi:hypothetical protein
MSAVHQQARIWLPQPFDFSRLTEKHITPISITCSPSYGLREACPSLKLPSNASSRRASQFYTNANPSTNSSQSSTAFANQLSYATSSYPNTNPRAHSNQPYTNASA